MESAFPGLMRTMTASTMPVRGAPLAPSKNTSFQLLSTPVLQGHLAGGLCAARSAPGAMLLVDNATSHVEQMAPVVALVTTIPRLPHASCQWATANSWL